MKLTIRDAKMDDAALIAGFNAALALESENLELDEDRLLAGVTNVLKDASKGMYLLAEADRRPVGQLMLTYEWSDWRNGMFWWIQSVFVEPKHRRQGVFRALYREVHGRAKGDPSVCGLRVYVVDENHRARAVYENMEMAPTPYRMYERDFVLHR